LLSLERSLQYKLGLLTLTLPILVMLGALVMLTLIVEQELLGVV
jgi:hypothetical protein